MFKFVCSGNCKNRRKSDLDLLIAREKSARARTHLLDIFVFAIFLGVATFVTFATNDILKVYFNKTIEEVFAKLGPLFKDINSVDLYWIYMESFIYSSHSFLFKWANKSEPVNFDVNNENFVIGPPRIRQIRIKPTPCRGDSFYAKQFPECYGPYSAKDEEKEDSFKGSRYYTAVEAGRFSNIPLIFNYHAGGYIVNLGFEMNDNLMILQKLKNSSWIDRGTRMVVVEMGVFNGNLKYFCEVNLAIEILPTGGVFPKYYINTITTFALKTPYDYALMVCFIFAYFMIAFYFLDDILRGVLKLYKTSFWASIWTYLDFILLLLGIGSLTLYFILPGLAKKFLDTYKKDPNTYKNFGELHFYDNLFSNINGMLLFVAYIRTFKYLSIIDTMQQFSKTLYRSAEGLFCFASLFLIMVFAYATSGVLLFGKDNTNFHDLLSATLTLLRMLVSHIDYESIYKANVTMAGPFVCSYIMVVFFFILNMFLAIFNDTYTEIKEEELETDPVIKTYLKSLFICKCCKKRWKKKKGAHEYEENINFQDVAEKVVSAVRQKEIVTSFFEILNEPTSEKLKKMRERLTILETFIERSDKHLEKLIQLQDLN